MAASMAIKINKIVQVEIKSKSLSDRNGGEGDREREVVPDKRSGHRIVVTDANLYSLGGYNPDFWDVENDEDSHYPLFRELWKFNFATKKWKRMKYDSFMPYELASHTIVLDKSNMIMFGGTSLPFGETNSNNINVCDLHTGTWKFYSCSGDKPDPKYGQSMTMVDRFIYIIGGTTGFLYNMDVHRLDLNTLEWSKLYGDKPDRMEPTPRYRHETIIYNEDIYLIAGGTSTESCPLDTVSIFSTVKLKWRLLHTIADKQFGFPAPRKCHSCVKLDNDVIICGGLKNEGIADDIWKLNLKTKHWTKLKTVLPVPVYFHSADVTPSGCMYIFGGVIELDRKRTEQVYKIWLKIPSLGELCWSILCDNINMDIINSEDLINSGIPSHYRARISGL